MNNYKQNSNDKNGVVFWCLMFFLVVMVNVSSAQEANSETPIVHEKVIQADSLSKDVIYSLIKQWVVETYQVNERRINLDDKDAGVLMAKSSFYYANDKGLAYERWEGNVDFIIKIQVRDNRYKVTLSDFKHPLLGLVTDREIHSTKGWNKKYNNKFWDDLKVRVVSFCETFFKNINSYTKYNGKESVENDW